MKARYAPRPIKPRRRRTKAQIAEIFKATLGILDGEKYPIVIRHLFYRIASLALISKTETEYKNLGRLLSKWRRQGSIDWGAFADSTRWHIQTPTFDGVQDALDRTVETYRRDLWSTQPYYCELWIEKDAIASIVAPVANSFGVPVFVCRGFTSLSSLHNASQTFNDAVANGKQVVIFHMGDYDPSGYVAGNAIENSLIQDFDCFVDFRRIAVTSEQIEELNLPTRPTKESTHATDWNGDESVELDAIPSADMRQIVEEAITSLINKRAWKQLQKIEAAERDSLSKLRIVA